MKQIQVTDICTHQPMWVNVPETATEIWDSRYWHDRACLTHDYPERLASSMAHKQTTKALGPRPNGYRPDPINWQSVLTDVRALLVDAATLTPQ